MYFQALGLTVSDPDNVMMPGNIPAQSPFPQAFVDGDRLSNLIASLNNVGTVRMGRPAGSEPVIGQSGPPGCGSSICEGHPSVSDHKLQATLRLCGLVLSSTYSLKRQVPVRGTSGETMMGLEYAFR